MTVKGGPAWRQPTYYPFMHCSRYGRGRVLTTIINSETYTDELYGDAPFVEGIIVQNDAEDELTFFAVNKHEESCECVCKLQGFENYQLLEHIVLNHEDLFAVNSATAQNNVAPHIQEGVVILEGEIRLVFEKYSWNVVRMKKSASLNKNLEPVSKPTGF
jgi:alpha-N-arabinofuranosidase